MFKRVITTILLFVTLVLVACSPFPAAKTISGTYTPPEKEEQTYTAIIDFEDEDTPIALDGDQMAQLAYYAEQAWLAFPELPNDNIEGCLENTYYIVASEETVHEVCDSNKYKACAYTEKYVQRGERLAVPYDTILISEEYYNDCDFSLEGHELIHLLHDCSTDRGVVDDLDTDHDTDHLWFETDENGHLVIDNLEYQVMWLASQHIDIPGCGV